MRYQFTKTWVDAAPDKHGIYVLFDGEEKIYIGRAVGDGVTIRSRLQAHLGGAEGPCTQKASHYEYDLPDDPAAVEARLIFEHRLLHGAMPRCNDVQPKG